MPSLYQLEHDYQKLADLAECATEEDATAFRDTLESLGGDIERKIQNCAFWCRNVETTVSVIDAEIDRLKKRKEVLQGNVGRMKEHMMNAMRTAGLEKVKGDLFTVAIQLNPPSVVVADEDAIPKAFKKHVPESWVLDKKAVADALKDGKEVTGASLDRKLSLRIR